MECTTFFFYFFIITFCPFDKERTLFYICLRAGVFFLFHLVKLIRNENAKILLAENKKNEAFIHLKMTAFVKSYNKNVDVGQKCKKKMRERRNRDASLIKSHRPENPENLRKNELRIVRYIVGLAMQLLWA